MKFREFVSEYYIETYGNYFSRYDIVEKGFMFKDASSYSLKELEQEFKKFTDNEEEWLKEYE